MANYFKPKPKPKKTNWEKVRERAQNGLSTGLKATSIAVKTTLLFNSREDSEHVAGVVLQAAEQELERRGMKKVLKKMVGKQPPKKPTTWEKVKSLGKQPPKKSTWQKVKSIGKKPPPPTAMQKAKTKVQSAMSVPWQKKMPPPSKAQRIRQGAWTTLNNGLDMLSTGVDLGRLAKSLQRRDPELLEEIVRRAGELERGDELGRRDVDLEDRDLMSLLPRDAELDELD